jgi:hypothetical protein
LNLHVEPSTSSPFRIERVTDSVYAAIARPAAKLNCVQKHTKHRWQAQQGLH